MFHSQEYFAADGDIVFDREYEDLLRELPAGSTRGAGSGQGAYDRSAPGGYLLQRVLDHSFVDLLKPVSIAVPVDANSVESSAQSTSSAAASYFDSDSAASTIDSDNTAGPSHVAATGAPTAPSLRARADDGRSWQD